MTGRGGSGLGLFTSVAGSIDCVGRRQRTDWPIKAAESSRIMLVACWEINWKEASEVGLI